MIKVLTYPTAWCSTCGPGGCEHTERLGKGLHESFRRTLEGTPKRKLPGITESIRNE